MEEALKYFSPSFFIKKSHSTVNNYEEVNFSKDKPVDFYILKKYMYKLRMMKFPQNTHFFIKLNEIYLEASEFHDEISRFLSEYNFGLEV